MGKIVNELEGRLHNAGGSKKEQCKAITLQSGRALMTKESD